MKTVQSSVSLCLSGVVWLFVISLITVPCYAIKTPETAAVIATQLCDSLSLNHPVVLDIRCGEWTPNLELAIRRALLSRQVDIREIGIDSLYGADEATQPDSSNLALSRGIQLLSALSLQRYDILEITLEQTYATGESRNLISYSHYQKPVYRFILKQITLPEQRLLTVREYSLNGEMELDNPGSILALKWYEPLVATALISALLIMLWTLK